MTQTATLPALLEQALIYHDFGFNALPLADPAKKATKHPSIPWKKGEKDYTQEHFTQDDITRNKDRYQHGIIAITGIGDNHNIDFDKVTDFSIVDEFLALLGLPLDYEWVVMSGSGAGAQIWIHHVEVDAHLPKNIYDFDAREKSRFAHVELRWRGNCCVLPPSKHPSGKVYRFRTGRFPDGPPAAIPLDRIQTALDAIGILRHAEKILPEQRKTPSGVDIVNTLDDSPYGLSALTDECQELAATPENGRNNRLNLAAFRLGQLVAGGELTEATVTRDVLDAADRCGLEPREATATFQSGLSAGLREPRSAPHFERVHHASYDSDKDALDLDSLTLENAKKLIIAQHQEIQQLKAKDTWWNTIMANPNLKTVQKLMIRQRIDVEQNTEPGKKKDGKYWWRIDTEADGKATGSDGTTISRNVPYLVAGGVLETWEQPITLKNGTKTHLIWSRLTGAEQLPGKIVVPSNWGGKADRCECGGELKFKTRVIQRQRIGTCKKCKKVRVFAVENVKSELPVTPIHLDDEPALEAQADDARVHHAPDKKEDAETPLPGVDDEESPSLHLASYWPEYADCKLVDEATDSLADVPVRQGPFNMDEYLAERAQSVDSPFAVGETVRYKGETLTIFRACPLWILAEGKNRRVVRVEAEHFSAIKRGKHQTPSP